VRKIAAQFGVDPGTVQISRPFEGASVAVAEFRAAKLMAQIVRMGRGGDRRVQSAIYGL
jgi:hypothetical protein